MDGDEARRRLPQHLVRDGDVALFDPEGGYVRSERAVFAAVTEAQRHGATFLGDRRVLSLDRHASGWSVRTGQEEVRAPRVLVATGTGAGPACAALGTHLAVLPQVLTWFPIADQDLLRSQPEQVFIRSSRDARYYGFPSTDGWTVKVAASIYLDEVASMTRPVNWNPRHLDTIQSWVAPSCRRWCPARSRRWCAPTATPLTRLACSAWCPAWTGWPWRSASPGTGRPALESLPVASDPPGQKTT